MYKLKIGDKAPSFTLLDQNSKSIALSDFSGQKVLVYFYPKASTPGCTTQACGLRDSKLQLDALGVTILGISPDEPNKLAKFSTNKQLNFSLLSDPEHKVANDFAVWGPKKFMGKVYDGIHRISFLIDENGMIEQIFDKFKTADHHQVVIDYLTKN